MRLHDEFLISQQRQSRITAESNRGRSRVYRLRTCGTFYWGHKPLCEPVGRLIPTWNHSAERELAALVHENWLTKCNTDRIDKWKDFWTWLQMKEALLCQNKRFKILSLSNEIQVHLSRFYLKELMTMSLIQRNLLSNQYCHKNLYNHRQSSLHVGINGLGENHSVSFIDTFERKASKWGRLWSSRIQIRNFNRSSGLPS